jgi:hypothetical protein
MIGPVPRIIASPRLFLLAVCQVWIRFLMVSMLVFNSLAKGGMLANQQVTTAVQRQDRLLFMRIEILLIFVEVPIFVEVQKSYVDQYIRDLFVVLISHEDFATPIPARTSQCNRIS